MYIELIQPVGKLKVSGGDEYEQYPYIQMKTADNKVVPWLASQTDILSDDWSVV